MTTKKKILSTKIIHRIYIYTIFRVVDRYHIRDYKKNNDSKVINKKQKMYSMLEKK